MYSFQINDYLGLGLNHDYFQNLLKQYSQKNFNEFTHFNLGLENGYSLVQYKTEIKKVIGDLGKYSDQYNLRPISLADFGDWFKARYPESSPAYFYKTKDTLAKSSEEVSWYQSPWYRLGLKSDNGQTKILDLRVYNRETYEDYFNTPNQSTSLFHEIPAVIDTIKTPSQVYNLNFSLATSIQKYNKYTDFWEITLVDINKKIILSPDKITFVGFSPPAINSKEIKVTELDGNTVWIFVPQTPFKTSLHPLWLVAIGLFVYFLFKKTKPPIIGIILALFAGSTLYRSGSLYSFGMGFWGPNGHDAIFHLSIIEHFRQNISSLAHPQFSGAYLKDYHFLFDYFLGFVAKTTSTPPTVLYFLIFPIFSSLAIVYFLNSLLLKWKYSNLEKNLAFIFVFLGGSLGYLPRLFSGQNILSGESAFWANQSSSMFLNPPFVLSIIVLLIFLNLLEPSFRTRSGIQKYVLLILLGGLLAQTKVYAFILLLGALLLNKKFKLFAGVLLVGVLITLPFISFSGSPFVFQPLWFTKSLFASPDRVSWPKLVQAWQTYELAGPFYKLFAVNLFALIVFLVGNLGFRLLGFFDRTQPIVKVIIALGILIPLFFTQKVNPWNTIQFMYYSIFFLGIFAGKELSRHKLLIVPVLFLATFTSFGTFRDYFSYRSASRIGYTELASLSVLKNQPKGIVLSPVFQNNLVATPKPQYAYVSSSYISALSGQPEFLSDTINLDITGIDYKERFNSIQRFYFTENKYWARQFLLNNNIKYVLETPLTHLKLNPADLGLTTIFDSGEINIYKFAQ